MDFLLALLPKIQHLGLWGYWAVLLAAALESTAFVGLFFPGTTIIVFAGFLTAQKILDVGDMIWFVAIGGIIGDSISFYLGRRGTNLFKAENKLLKKSHLETAETFFNRHGAKSIFLARFIGPVRPLVPFVAGLSKMNTKKFFLFNILGGFAAATVYVLIGYFFGEAWGRVGPLLEQAKVALLILFGAGVIGYILRKKLF